MVLILFIYCPFLGVLCASIRAGVESLIKRIVLVQAYAASTLTPGDIRKGIYLFRWIYFYTLTLYVYVLTKLYSLSHCFP